MAVNQEPYKGLRFKINSTLFEVEDVQRAQRNVVTFIIGKNGNKIKQRNFPLVSWPPKGYEEVVESNQNAVDVNENGNGNSDADLKTIKKVFSIVIDEDGKLTVRDKDGLIVLDMDEIRGPQGKEGKAYPVVKDGQLFFTDKDGKAITTPLKIKGEEGVTYEPVFDENTGQLRFKNSETGELRPGGFDIKGKDGNDGKSFEPRITKDGQFLYFVDGDGKEIPGQYLIKGTDGQNGREFIPHVTEEGFLFFTDSKGNEVPGTRVNLKGADGKTGTAFTPQIDSKGNLSWTNDGGLPNPTPVNIKGDSVEGPEGATFIPYIKDGVLYWYNNKGLDNPTPIRINGAKGDPGPEGKRGLSAYQIWLKQGYRGTEQDFLDSLKGEKGSPAPPASFSFKDVEDFTCKVQKIDTNLIIDKDDDTASPEEIINYRSSEIKKLREDGHTDEYRKKHNVGMFKRFFWWCAGADPDLLTMCPGDHSKYVGIGTVIFFTALMAWFSSFIAIRLVFDPISLFGHSIPLPAIAFAIFWGAMIFFLDRFITNTMYSDGKVTISKQEFVSGLPRILIAIFLGIVISAPLELKIFASKISLEMDKQYEKELSEAKDKAQEEATKKFNNELRHKNLQLNQYTNSKSAIDTKIASMNPPEAKLGQRSTWIEDGQVVGGGSKITNQGEIDLWHKQNDSLKKDLQAKSESYQEKISGIEEEIAKADSTRKAQEQQAVNRAETRFNTKFDRKLSRQLTTLHDIAMEGYVPWFYKDKPNNFEDVSTDENSNSSAIQKSNSKEDKYMYGAENHKFAAAMDSILHAWWWYLFNSAQGLIMLLFILIDISPVLYKMMLADGNYDNYLHQEKLLAQDKIRLSLSNMLKKLNDSELKRVAPFIMGDIYEKMAGDSYIYKTEKEFKDEIDAQKKVHWFWGPFWRIWPFSMIRWIFWKEEDKPTAPVIVLNKKENTPNQDAVIDANNKVFEEVLDMKKKIILASYRRWYKTQHDCIICDDVNDENKAREPFDDEAPEGDDSEIHIDDNDVPERDDDFMDENLHEGTSKTDDDESDEENTEDSDSESKEGNVTEEIDDDEHELPDDDGDDNPKK